MGCRHLHRKGEYGEAARQIGYRPLVGKFILKMMEYTCMVGLYKFYQFQVR